MCCCQNPRPQQTSLSIDDDALLFNSGRKQELFGDIKAASVTNCLSETNLHLTVPGLKSKTNGKVFIACGGINSKTDNPFRKPKSGMWHIMEKHFNDGIPIDMDQSFYVGDAAGRPDDHSDADIKFAQDNFTTAITYYHKALGLKLEDHFCTEMLHVALVDECRRGVDPKIDFR